MTRLLLKAWLLKVFFMAQPIAPWTATYDASADAMARVAVEAPLFQGPDGAQRTAALLASVAWYESRLNPQAKGDCRNRFHDGTCSKTDPQFQSFCLFQIGRSNFPALGLASEEDVLSSPRTCTLAARRMMSISFGVCRGRPFDEWLGHYASGGISCGGLRESRHRVKQAIWYLDHVPLPVLPAEPL